MIETLRRARGPECRGAPRLLIPLVVLLSLCGCRSAGDELTMASPPPADTAPAIAEHAEPPALSDEARALNKVTFEQVWTTIRDKHWDPTLHGVDWPAVHDEFLPKIENARSMAETRELLNAMLERLGQSHFGVIPADLNPEPAAQPGVGEVATTAGAPGSSGTAGLEFRFAEGQILVTRVRSADPRAQQIRPGWAVTKIRGEPTSEIVRQAQAAESQRLPMQLLVHAAIAERLEGTLGEALPLTLLDGESEEVNIDLPLVAPTGSASQFGGLSFSDVQFESRELDGGIGYIAFNLFFAPSIVLVGYEAAIEQFREAKGIVIDLRGNPGGIGFMAMGMAGWLMEGDGKELGTMERLGEKLKFVINPRQDAFLGPVAILLDELSASTSEIFAGGLQDLGRARVFGGRSAGAALPSIVDLLPNGDRFQYAIANYVSVGGKVLEGNGVIPDVETPITRAALLRGEDPALAAAVAWIESKQTN